MFRHSWSAGLAAIFVCLVASTSSLADSVTFDQANISANIYNASNAEDSDVHGIVFLPAAGTVSVGIANSQGSLDYSYGASGMSFPVDFDWDLETFTGGDFRTNVVFTAEETLNFTFSGGFDTLQGMGSGTFQVRSLGPATVISSGSFNETNKTFVVSGQLQAGTSYGFTVDGSLGNSLSLTSTTATGAVNLELSPAAVPLPPAAWGGLALFGGMGINRLRLRRKASLA